MQQEALGKIRALGLPTRRTEDWSYFPTSLLSKISRLTFIDDAHFKIDAGDARNVERLAESNFSAADFQIEKETDISALLPLALGAKSFVKEIPEGANETGILKAHDEFSHTVFRLGKNAKASLEILEKKRLSWLVLIMLLVIVL